MISYVIKRLLSLIPVLLTVAVIVFTLVHLSPGDPARVILGPDASSADIIHLRDELGLNKPIVEQFVLWLSNAATGDLGNSIYNGRPVTEVFFRYFMPTLSLAIFAQFIAITVAIPLGTLAALNRGKQIDRVLMTFSLIGISVPSFLLGLIFILIFSVFLNWLPVAGYIPMRDSFVGHYKHLLLPALSLGLMQAALITRITRSSMLEVLNNQYIKTAKAKGLSRRTVVIKHALRNAFIPILEIIGQTFTMLIAGAVVVEFVFNIPGLGQLIVNSVERRDFPIIQGVILMVALGYVIINLVIDLIYGIVDPRVRLDK
tara:strand:+ start:8467 stop:9414 length:948 start_codon:yes stop_codon:yes gene_type:complete